jgi:hypothetical protein
MSNLTHPKSSVGACCRNAAMMLQIADQNPIDDKELRTRILKANAGQAELLHKAADIADEMLVALKALLAATMYKDHPAESAMAIAAIEKAEAAS